MLFPKSLARSETQSFSSKIWTRVAESIFTTITMMLSYLLPFLVSKLNSMLLSIAVIFSIISSSDWNQENHLCNKTKDISKFLSVLLVEASCYESWIVLMAFFKIYCSEYDTNLHLMVRLQFRGSWGVLSTPQLPLIPGLLTPEVVVDIRVQSMGQIALFKNSSFRWNCV